MAALTGPLTLTSPPPPCRLQRGNLFMDIVSLLSRTALPHSAVKVNASSSSGSGGGGGGLGPLHAVSLEALLAVLHAIAAE